MNIKLKASNMADDENKNKSSEEKVDDLIQDIESIGIFKVEKKEDGELEIRISENE